MPYALRWGQKAARYCSAMNMWKALAFSHLLRIPSGPVTLFPQLFSMELTLDGPPPELPNSRTASAHWLPADREERPNGLWLRQWRFNSCLSIPGNPPRRLPTFTCYSDTVSLRRSFLLHATGNLNMGLSSIGPQKISSGTV